MGGGVQETIRPVLRLSKMNGKNKEGLVMQAKKIPFKEGKAYQHNIAQKMSKMRFDNKCYSVEEVEGAKSGADICIVREHDRIGVEIKDNGAFEGGSIKMKYDDSQKRLVFSDINSLHQKYLGNTILYNGLNLPWYEGKQTVEEYEPLADIFDKEVRIPISSASMSEYYRGKNVYYIQIERYGLYHTGNDILKLGVPLFECDQCLRIRTSKHKKKINNKRVPTDVVGDINYNKKTLKKSVYDLDNELPAAITTVEE
jgi:hypothetical protein